MKTNIDIPGKESSYAHDWDSESPQLQKTVESLDPEILQWEESRERTIIPIKSFWKIRIMNEPITHGMITSRYKNEYDQVNHTRVNSVKYKNEKKIS